MILFHWFGYQYSFSFFFLLFAAMSNKFCIFWNVLAHWNQSECSASLWRYGTVLYLCQQKPTEFIHVCVFVEQFWPMDIFVCKKLFAIIHAHSHSLIRTHLLWFYGMASTKVTGKMLSIILCVYINCVTCTMFLCPILLCSFCLLLFLRNDIYFQFWSQASVCLYVLHMSAHCPLR